MRSTASWHVLVLARSSGADSTTTTKALPLPLPAVLATVPSRRVRAGSIGSALNAAKLVLVLVCGEKGEEGEAVLVSRRERRVAADGVRASGGGLRFVGGCVEGARRSAVAAAGLFVLRGAAAGVGELAAGGWLGNALARGESGLGLVGEAGKLGPAVNLLLLVGETRGPLGDGGRSMLLRRE